MLRKPVLIAEKVLQICVCQPGAPPVPPPIDLRWRRIPAEAAAAAAAMGNKIGRRRQAVEDKYTRPQGLYQHRDIDHKKLRKLILDAKLAPCYLGDEDSALDLEECPICFLYYPSLNRSRCCMKGICTECFLQMKPPNSTRPTQCPFCKTSNYAVEYRGMRTKEEKGIEQIEEQKVIEAKIRMWQQELQEEEVRMQKKQETSSSDRVVTPAIVEHQSVTNSPLSVPSCRFSTTHGDGSVSSQVSPSPPLSRSPSRSRQNREGNFDLDLEEIMVMEAIWLSIQEQGAQRNQACSSNSVPGQPSSGDCYNSLAVIPTESSPSGGLACAVAALAEHQHMNVDSTNMTSTSAPVFDMQQRSGSMPAAEEGLTTNYHSECWNEASSDSGRPAHENCEWEIPDSARAVLREEGEWATDYGSEVAEAGTSIAGSDVTADAGVAAVSLPEGVGAAGGNILPESFEEQMMLAMAVSLAEARARTNAPGMTWL